MFLPYVRQKYFDLQSYTLELIKAIFTQFLLLDDFQSLCLINNGVALMSEVTRISTVYKFLLELTRR